MSAGTDDSLYSSAGPLCCLAFPIYFRSRDQMITEVLLRSVFGLKGKVIPVDATKAYSGGEICLFIYLRFI